MARICMDEKTKNLTHEISEVRDRELEDLMIAQFQTNRLGTN
jgi:hypothetical protein